MHKILAGLCQIEYSLLLTMMLLLHNHAGQQGLASLGSLMLLLRIGQNRSMVAAPRSLAAEHPRPSIRCSASGQAQRTGRQRGALQRESCKRRGHSSAGLPGPCLSTASVCGMRPVACVTAQRCHLGNHFSSACLAATRMGKPTTSKWAKWRTRQRACAQLRPRLAAALPPL